MSACHSATGSVNGAVTSQSPSCRMLVAMTPETLPWGVDARFTRGRDGAAFPWKQTHERMWREIRLRQQKEDRKEESHCVLLCRCLEKWEMLRKQGFIPRSDRGEYEGQIIIWEDINGAHGCYGCFQLTLSPRKKLHNSQAFDTRNCIKPWSTAVKFPLHQRVPKSH